MKKVLVLGANGATGRLVVKSLLHKGVKVIAVVRNADSLKCIDDLDSSLQIVEANISDMPEKDLAQHLVKCDTVISCLGHNVTLKGIFGQPKRLVTNTVKKVTKTIEASNAQNKTKLILMNSNANSNRDIPEKPPFSQKMVIALLRFLLPPISDNEQAADFLRLYIGQNNKAVAWTAVRPAGLINEAEVSAYAICPSPTRNVIFNDGSASRINVADFMADLVVNTELWNAWEGKMPVIYNHEGHAQ